MTGVSEDAKPEYLSRVSFSNVPCLFLQVSQTKDLARFHTPDVLRLQQELLRAKESRNIAARQAWAELVCQVNYLITLSICTAASSWHVRMCRRTKH